LLQIRNKKKQLLQPENPQTSKRLEIASSPRCPMSESKQHEQFIHTSHGPYDRKIRKRLKTYQPSMLDERLKKQ